MALLGLCFRGGTGIEIDQVDVVNDYIGVVFLAPLFGEGPVKPCVIGGDKVAPLQNLERFLLRGGPLRKQECRPQRSSSDSTRSGDFDEISARYTLALLIASCCLLRSFSDLSCLIASQNSSFTFSYCINVLPQSALRLQEHLSSPPDGCPAPSREFAPPHQDWPAW